MNLICKINGHKFFKTLEILRKEGVYDIIDAKYCNRCGMIV